MRIAVQHRTVYRYDCAVRLDAHTFRLRPRSNSAQRLLMWEIHVMPIPAGTSECLDQDGNLAFIARFDSLTRELTVASHFRIDILRDNPFDFALNEASLNLPLKYVQPLCAALAPYLDYARVHETVRQYATTIAFGVRWNSLSFLDALNQRLFTACRQMTRPDGAPWPSEVTLQRLEGSCRDLAVLFCDACRVMGIAARFVSGYESAAAGRQDSYMHAWAEVYLPGAGWRGYDPSRGLVVARGHVAVAAGFDHNLASPIAGSFSGGVATHMETSLEMQVEPESNR